MVTGANGQLGSEIRRLETNFPEYKFLFTDYEELSIIDEEAVEKFLKKTGRIIASIVPPTQQWIRLRKKANKIL